MPGGASSKYFDVLWFPAGSWPQASAGSLKCPCDVIGFLSSSDCSCDPSGPVVGAQC